MPGAFLLVLLGSLVVTQTLFGEAFERLNVKAAITGGGSSSSGGATPSSDTAGAAGIVPAGLPNTGGLPVGVVSA